MKTATLHASYDFVFPKLHAQWSEAVTGARLESLLQGGDETALLRFFATAGVETRVKAEIQKSLTARVLEQLGRILRVLEPAGAAFYAAFVSRYYYDNLKAILHYRRQPDPTVNLPFLIIESSWLPHLHLDTLVAAKTVNQFYRALPDTPLRLGILPALVELDETGDVCLADSRLDHLFYRELLTKASAVPAAAELVRLEVDLFDVVMLLRNAEIYHLPEDALRELLVEGGLHLTPALLARLAAMPDPARITAALPDPYKGILQPRLQQPLYLRENALWEYLYRQVNRVFRDFGNPAASVAAFPFLKRTELQNLCRLYEGFRVGLAPADIRSMLIGLASV